MEAEDVDRAPQGAQMARARGPEPLADSESKMVSRSALKSSTES